MSFAKRLKTAMMVCAMKQIELAKATGLEQTNISHILSGQREPNLENLAKIIRALPGIDARWLISGEFINFERCE